MTDREYARLMRFLGSGYVPKAAQDSPKIPYEVTVTANDRRLMHEIKIDPDK